MRLVILGISSKDKNIMNFSDFDIGYDKVYVGIIIYRLDANFLFICFGLYSSSDTSEPLSVYTSSFLNVNECRTGLAFLSKEFYTLLVK